MARSPSVEAFEKDGTLNATSSGESAAGFAGDFDWGPCELETTVSSIDDLIAFFAKPTDRNYADWFSASNFLNYSSKLYVVRAIDEDTALNAGVAPAAAPGVGNPLTEPKGFLVKSANHFETSKGTNTCLFTAKYPGELGNSIAVHIADNGTFAKWKYKNLFDSAPDDTPGSAVNVAAAMDEIHVVIIDSLGSFTNVPGSVLETYSYLAKSRDGRDLTGSNAYYANVINRTSKYVYAVNVLGDAFMKDTAGKSPWGGKIADKKPFAQLKVPFEAKLGLGTVGTKPTKADYIQGYSIFESIEDEDMNMIITGNCGGDENHADVANAVLDMCQRSMRMVGFVSPKATDVVGGLKQDIPDKIEKTYEDLTSLHSYGHMSTAYKMQYDKFNDVYRWIPGNADDAGLYARTHNQVGKFASAAGYNRGKYANIVALAYSPDKTVRDRLYRSGINAVIQEKGEGIILMGDRTLQLKDSAFRTMGVRFLFIDLRLTISRSAKYNLFEFNDSHTRAQFRDSTEPVLRDIRGKKGIVDYRIVCDETNNTVDVIQRGEFIGDIYIKPQYSIQFVILNFNAVDQGVNFEERFGA